MEMPPENPDKVWTYDELASLPADGQRYEILDGHLVVSPAPSWWHQVVLKQIFVLLYELLDKARIADVYFAPLDVILSPTRVVEPDLVVVRCERRSVFERRGLRGAPDLVVEVLSLSNARHDRVDKRRFYAHNGVPEYWIVDPEAETIEVLELIEGGLSYRQHGWYANGDQVVSPTFEISIAVDAVFRRPDAGE